MTCGDRPAVYHSPGRARFAPTNARPPPCHVHRAMGGADRPRLAVGSPVDILARSMPVVDTAPPAQAHGSLGVFVQGARFILLNPDPNQLTRDIMPLGKRVQALPGNELLRDLSMLWERCVAMAFIL
jgi:hypothetical protein